MPGTALHTRYSHEQDSGCRRAAKSCRIPEFVCILEARSGFLRSGTRQIIHDMRFNLIEKLAILKAIDEVIQMDEEIKSGEVKFMERLAEVLEFEPDLITEAREVEPAEAIAVLKVMPSPHKQTLARLMNEAANSDGEVDEREIQFIYRVFSAAGIDVEI